MNLEQLTRIYNTLLLIHTNGEDTVIMGDCLKAFKEWIETTNKAQKEVATSSTTPTPVEEG